jgi:GNAT superfamily N-acetyltransferase
MQLVALQIDGRCPARQTGAVTIRERTPADLPAAVAALREVHEADRYPTAWPADPAGWLTPPGLLRAWVAEVDEAVVAGVAAVDGVTDDGLARAVGVPGAELVLVSRLHVAPGGRGHGLARQLVGAVVAYADTLGRRTGLDVMEASTAAIALYESLGWSYHGSEVAAWRTQDGNHPTIRYYLAPTAR